VIKNPHVIWACVVIVFMMIGGAVVLSALDRDVSAIMNLAIIIGIPVLAALGVGGYQQVMSNMEQVKEVGNQVKDISNGRMTEMMDMVAKLHNEVTALALQVPAAPTNPAESNGGSNDDPSAVLLRPSG
jgi:hypothetical protein